jgi:hypothetical protein
MAVRLVARSIDFSSGPLLFAAAIRDPGADEGANQPVRPIGDAFTIPTRHSVGVIET